MSMAVDGKPKAHKKNVPPTQNILTHSTTHDDAKQYYHIMLFNRAIANNDHEKCPRLLSKIHAHNPTFSSPALVNYLFSTDQFEAASTAANNYRLIYGADEWAVNFAAARSLSAQQKNDLAESMFEEAQRTAKKTWAQEQTTYAQAIFYIQTKKPHLALAQVDRFLENNPPRAKHAPFYILKATVHLNSTHPNLEQALSQLNKGLELNPHLERGLKLKALVLEQQNKKFELVEVLQKLTEIEPQQALFKKLVSLFFELEKFQEAYAILSKIPEQTADHLFDLALLSWKLKETDRALVHINEAIKVNPEFSRARLLKLEMFLSSNRKTEALNHLKDWIIVDHNAKVFSVLATLTSANIVSPKEALTILTPLQKNRLMQKEIHSFVGDLHVLTENYKAAEHSYRNFIKSLSKADKNLGIKAFYNLGFIQWKQENIKGALGEISKAHSIAPKNSLISSVLAFLYTQQEDKTKMKFAKKLLRSTQENPHGDNHAHLNSLMTAQENAYRFSPFWSHFDKIMNKQQNTLFEHSITTTQNSHTQEF
jgi:tetratricopeptide (TPR) repeat protein